MLKNFNRYEGLTLAFIAIITLIGFVLSYLDHDFFKETFVTEDGFIEWLTVIALVMTMIVSFRRVWVLRHHRSSAFLAITALVGLLFLFGAGEEISWGQRILNIESTDFFKEHNAQGEINLHNLVVKDTKINKLVFGKILGILLLLYLAVICPLYKSNQKARKIADQLAIPIATRYQTIAYVLILILVQVLMVSSKKGELLEFSVSFMFFLNITFPYNRSIFVPPASAAQQQD
ncbi:MAG: hypothetical protein EP297_15090 [Gammaproteobacteria bacterium]|nr:MAG: hypothetical protein EP297_15090 [Gammaproteobacteria bacterium]